MPVRTFDDGAGARWEVFEVHRASDRPGAVSAGMELGWLAFVHGAEKRRLAPIPSGWEQVSDAELLALCATARAAGPRPDGTRPPTTRPPLEVTPEPGAGSPAAPSADASERREVERVVRAFAVAARDRHQPAVSAMVELKAVLAERFPGDSHVARDRRVVRRWFVESYYFARNA